MNARLIYLILIPLGFLNIIFYYVWVYLTEVEPSFLQFTLIQILANFIAASYIIDHIKKDDFY